MDPLDRKLLDAFDGKVVRKDLLHRIKKGTNVPTFVLEFLLARYCASDDPEEIQAGLEAVLATLQDNYVRPDEANAAQSKVATKGRHRFIDKVHVRYVEREKRHWAALENFNSQRIAVAEKFYRDNERLLEGGIWAEVTVAYNEIDEDDYAFYVEDLRPIQLSRFDFEGYVEGRRAFTPRRVAGRGAALGRAGAGQAEPAPEAALRRPPGPAGRAQLQLHRAGAARHRQVLLLQRVLPLRHPGQRRPGHQGHPLLQQRPPPRRPGRLLGHGGLRRGGRHQASRTPTRSRS